MAHSHTNVICHIVFATKYRSPLIAAEHRPRVHEYLGGTLRGFGALPLITNGTEDHVRLLAKIRQNHSLADLIRGLKSNSTRWNRATLTGLDSFSWQRGYGAFSVSKSQVPKVRAYIERQEEHHRRMTFAEELDAMLRANGIVVDRAHIHD